MTDDKADDHAISEAFRQDMEDKLTSIVENRRRYRADAKLRAEERAMHAPWGGIFDRKEPEEPEVFAVHETAIA